MPAPLEYAPPIPAYRRRRFIAVFAVPALAVACVLTVPRFKDFQARQAKRAAVRQQFETQLSLACEAFDCGNLTGTAYALLRAEFPRRTDAWNFGEDELRRMDARLAAVRAPLLVAAAKQRAAADAKALIEQTTQAESEAHDRRHIQVRHVDREILNRLKTIEALVRRAGGQLRSGNYTSALGICEQIVELDPGHEFDADFWSQVAPLPR